MINHQCHALDCDSDVIVFTQCTRLIEDTGYHSFPYCLLHQLQYKEDYASYKKSQTATTELHRRLRFRLKYNLRNDGGHSSWEDRILDRKQRLLQLDLAMPLKLYKPATKRICRSWKPKDFCHFQQDLANYY